MNFNSVFDILKLNFRQFKLFRSLSFVVVSVVLFLVGVVGVNAQGQTCSVDKTISIASVFNPRAFIPIVPASCSEGIKPLALSVLPDIILRLYGFIVSIGIYFLLLATAVASIVWIYGGFDEGQIANARRIIRNAIVGLLILISSYAIVLETLRITLGNEGSKIFTGTSVESLFTN
jgi:hypothetical protein